MGFEALNPSFETDVRSSFEKQIVMKSIGARLERVGPGMCEIGLAFRTDLTQQNGFIHAGIVATIGDSACGYAAYSLMPPNSDVLSVEFKVNLLRPASGEKFVAIAEVIKPGKTLTVVRADVFGIGKGSERTLIATMQATMICIAR